MTEQEWLTCDNPRRMLEWIRLGNVAADDDYPPNYPHCPIKVSLRQLRLFAVASCRQVWHLLTDPRSRQAVEVAERFADGKATEAEFEKASRLASLARTKSPFFPWNDETPDRAKDMAALAVANLFQPAAFYAAREVNSLCGNFAAQAVLLRDIVGNPFRPVQVADADLFWWRRWNDHAISRVAETIYDELAFDRMPILADALEEAGATCQEILEHCRAPAIHTRGCWVVDLLLGKN